MKTQSPDTHPDIENLTIEDIRRMSAAEKFAIVAELNRRENLRALEDVRRRYPDADERECQLRVASRRIPAELMKKAFGWDPEEKGY